MVLNEVLKLAVMQQWEAAGRGSLQLGEAVRVPGGDISRCYRLDSSCGRLFLKINEPRRGAHFFGAEYRGLRLLRDTGTLRVPEPWLYGETADGCFLVMEFLEKGTPAPSFWEDFAEKLAAQHRHSTGSFGLKEDNFIGTLPQDNRPLPGWAAFYGERRLWPLVRRCTDEGLLTADDAHHAEDLIGRLETLLPPEPPALLHGDLWGGNFIPGPSGEPCVFDPAVYYGSREMDLAMTRLFGGFDRKFYWCYEQCYPLEPGWQTRIPLYQLYPLLVHAVLFGGGYARQAARVLSEY